METNNGRKSYFQHRISQLGSDNTRTSLGEREILTLLTLLGLNDSPQVLHQKKIIDLGGGDQYIKSSIQRRGGHYTGLDINDCNFEVDSIPCPEASMDIAICLALIEHLYDPSIFLNECKRILKPGGFLWLSTPDIQACGTSFWNDPTHVHPYTRTSLSTLLRQQGFEFVLVTPNFRCMNKALYRDTDLAFFIARRLKFLSGTSKLFIPSIFKGRSLGLFALAQKEL